MVRVEGDLQVRKRLWKGWREGGVRRRDQLWRGWKGVLEEGRGYEEGEGGLRGKKLLWGGWKGEEAAMEKVEGSLVNVERGMEG